MGPALSFLATDTSKNKNKWHNKIKALEKIGFWRLSKFVSSFLLSCPPPLPQYNPCLFCHLACWFHKIFSSLPLELSRVTSHSCDSAHQGRHWLLGGEEKAGGTNVRKASLYQPSDWRVLWPPHTQLAHVCFAVPTRLCREEKPPGFLPLSPAVQEGKESSALLRLVWLH